MYCLEGVRDWIAAIGAKIAYIEVGSLLEKSFNARIQVELLNGEIFYSLWEAKTLIEQWRIHCNTGRSHSSVGYRQPTPVSIVSMDQMPIIR